MPDNIFDYFGGNSSRKVEPLNEDEMFEDLLPEKNEQESEDGPDIEEPVGEIVDAEIVMSSETPGAKSDATTDPNEGEISSAEGDQETSVDGEDDPWSDLASSLGLEPTPLAKPIQSRTSVVLDEVELVSDLDVDSEQQHDPVDEPESASSKSMETPEQVGDSEDVLSEMFVPQEDPDVYSGEDTDVDFDDDPFAAFSGSAETVEMVEADEPVEDEVDEPVAIDDEADKDYVEFEVTDLGGRVDKEREERTGRRPQRRRRGRGSVERDDEGTVDHRESKRHDSDDDRDDSTNRRGSRRRSRDTVEQRKDSGRDRDTGRDRESSGRSKERGRNRKIESSQDEGDDRSRKKKPRIPTWQEAIGVVIDENIKRHESNASSGRGGRRRRKN